LFYNIAAILLVIILPFLAKHFLVQLPLVRYWWGLDYVFFINHSPVNIIYIWFIIFIVIACVLYIPEIKNYRFLHLFSLFSPLILLLIIYVSVFKIAYPKNHSKWELMKYDYHCRMKNWNKVIEMADRKSPTTPMTVAYLNLALYKTGQLSDKMFHYFQSGPEGLIPSFHRDFMIPAVAGEIYWYLGFVNTAQRFTFESMEALPGYQKSVRSVKRLAETNLINEYYETSEKYLSILEKTLFYRKWAKETRTYINNDIKIYMHPEWSEIRRFRTNVDFMHSNAEKDMMLGVIFQQNIGHRMAYEYLMAYTLLTKNIESFPVYFRLKKDFAYNEIPKAWQETLVYIWGLKNDDMESIPIPISNTVKNDVMNYARIYTSQQSPEQTLRNQFSKTYWYYYHFHDYKQKKSESSPQY